MVRLFYEQIMIIHSINKFPHVMRLEDSSLCSQSSAIEFYCQLVECTLYAHIVILKCMFYYYSLFTPRYSNWSLFQGVCIRKFIHIFCFFLACYVSRLFLPSSFNQLNKFRSSSSFYNFLPFSVHSYFVCPNILS
jgi:hypothetical protein